MFRLTEKEIATSILRSVQKDNIMDCLHQFRVIFTKPESLLDTTTKRPRNQFLEQAANHHFALLQLMKNTKFTAEKHFG